MRYEYMKEYETNWKQPEGLADDVEVECCTAPYNKWRGADLAANWFWSTVKKFRIVDKRFEHPNMVYGSGLDKPPRGVIANKTTSDTDVGSSWHERGELPPIGEVVEYYSGEMAEWRKCNIGAHWKSGVIIVDAGCEITYTHNLRPIRTERDKLVERAERDMESRTSLIASTPQIEALIEAGWRPIKQQSEVEFVKQCVDICEHGSTLLYRAGCRFIEEEK